MYFRFLLSLIFCLISNAYADHSISSYLTSENDTLSIVDETINAYNGKLVQIDKDIEIQGSHPLEVIRYYDGGHHFDSEIGYSYGLSFPIFLAFNRGRHEKNMTLEQRIGSEIVCTVTKQKKGKKDYYKGGVDPEYFKTGFTNCCEALLRGEPSLQAMQIEGDEHQFVVTLGDGTKRYYSYFHEENLTGFFRLIREDCPNGNHRHFSYENLLNLKQIWTTNSNNTLIFNCLNFSYKDGITQIDASNGQSVCYHQKKKTGTAKRRNGLAYSSVKFSKALLQSVTGDHLPTVDYEPISRSHFTGTLFSTKQINKPDGRSIKIDYDDEERIHKLWTSGVNVPLYEVNYHHDHTTVTDANGGIQRFYFNQRRLVKHEEPHRIQHFEWDKQGQLKKHLLTDANAFPIVNKEYEYDSYGNIQVAKIMASIQQSGKYDIYEAKYHYSDDGRNLLLAEVHPEGHTITYAYLPNTNLLTTKLIWTPQGIVEREFHQYDTNGICIGTIHDDGCTFAMEDFTNVTYRKITEIYPQLNPYLPGMSLPWVIQEGYDDPKTGIRHYLKRIERAYVQGDLLAEEKIYDATGKYCYTLKYEYNERRELISETDPLGYQTVYVYDANGNKIFEEKIGTGRKVAFVYNTANHLVNEVEALAEGHIFTTTHEYDPLGNRIKTTDLFGQKTTFEYDLANNQKTIIDSLGYRIQKEYDIHGNVIHQIDQDGHHTITHYNLYGDPLEIHYPDGTNKHFIYNLRGHLIYEKERDGQTTFYDVDYKGRVKVANTYSNTTLLKTIQKFYKGPNLILEIDAMGNQISYDYDGAGRLISKNQENIQTRFEYDSLGRLAKTITPENTVIKEYDYLDQVIEERIEDDGKVFQKTTYAYDCYGNCCSQKSYLNSDLFSESKTHYNSKNLPMFLFDAHGNLTTINYLYSDHLEKEITDPLGRKTLEIFDSLQRLKEVRCYSPTGLLFAHHALNYDGRGNQITHVENILCEGQHIGFYLIDTTYDCMGQKLSETEQNKKTTKYSYYLGRLHQIINPDGVILTHTYDALGRLATLTSSDGTIDYQYTYDSNDNLLSAEDPKAGVKRSYDALNRLTYEKQATGLEVSYSYDSINRLKEVHFPNGKICYEYNPSTLVSAKRYRNNELLYQYTQTTDWRGKVLSSEFPHCNVTYTWDLMGRNSTINSPYYQQTASYDVVGNLKELSVEDPKGSYTSVFTYDDANQLVSETGPFENRYLFDSIHNRRLKNTEIHTINDLNQVTSDNISQFTYDPNGRRTAKDDSIYTYDALGRLTSFSDANQSIQYKYDPFGRMYERSADKSTKYLYQFDTEIASFENEEITTFKAIYGNHSPFAIELNEKVYSPLRNHRGDICVLLEDTLSSYRYNAFGEFVHEGKVHSPWLLSGQRFDLTTYLYHYAKREYDPFLGLWLTPDPLGFADGPNLYAYVHNRPLIYTDPYGLWAEETSKMEKHEQHKRNLSEFRKGFSRGFLDDSTFGASEYVLGEHQSTSLSNQIGYHTGTVGSLAAGCFYGSTYLKGAALLSRGGLKASRAIKTIFNATKEAKTLANAKRVSQLSKESNVAIQNLRQSIFKTNGNAVQNAYSPILKSDAAKGAKLNKQNHSHKISQLEGKISEWLGKETKMIKNKAGDSVFLSKDGTRKVRFDLSYPAPHSNPHGHVEEFINGKWVKSGPIYPNDVPHY